MTVKPGAFRFNTDSMKLEIFRGADVGIGTLAAGQWEEIQATSPDVQTGGTRGVIGGGNNPSALTDIEFVTISSTGNATDYADLTDSRGALTALASRTRAVFACGYSPGDVNTIDFITIASGGTAEDFGDNTASGNNGARYAPAGVSNSTRGLIAGGQAVPAGTKYAEITYVTIAQTGNSVAFGDLTVARGDSGACANSTRGCLLYTSPSPRDS